MSLMEKVLDVALRAPRVRRMRQDLLRLDADDEKFRWLWNALLATINRDLSPQEAEWVERIERLRQQLRSSRAVVSRVDYGARTPNSHLTDEMMYQGEMVSASVGEICRNASNPSSTALLLFSLIRALRPSVCLELGTSLGITAAYQAAALTLNQRGRLVTLEGAAPIAALAGDNLRSLGLTNVSVVVGRFQDTLEGVLRQDGPIDFAFVDGHHDEHATVRYFEQIRPALSTRAVLVFDDIGWSDGMRRAWKAITEHSDVSLAVDLSAMGVCVIGGTRARQPVIRWGVL
jgi:predicted O-methyltransferase YrrM